METNLLRSKYFNPAPCTQKHQNRYITFPSSLMPNKKIEYIAHSYNLMGMLSRPQKDLGLKMSDMGYCL